MSHHEMSVADVKKHVRVYIGVFALLLVLTGVTVGVSYLHLSIGAAVGVALLVASIKGTMVACYFMHLISEKAMLFWILALCGFFFLVLLLVPVITVHDSVGVH
ncbi:MAG: cytochrome C oxidase subunit IV family protein [Planctomycetota bacterium]